MRRSLPSWLDGDREGMRPGCDTVTRRHGGSSDCAPSCCSARWFCGAVAGMAAVPFRFDLHTGSDGSVDGQIVNLTTARAPLLRSVTAGARLAGGWCRVVEAGYPVSIKDVLIRDGRVLLVHNERDE